MILLIFILSIQIISIQHIIQIIKLIKSYQIILNRLSNINNGLNKKINIILLEIFIISLIINNCQADI